MSKHQRQRAMQGGTLLNTPNPSKLIIPKAHQDAQAIDRKDPHQMAMATLVQYAQTGRTVLAYCEITRDIKAGETVPVICLMGKPNPDTGKAGLLPSAILFTEDATSFLKPPTQIEADERGVSKELACSKCEWTGPKKPTPEELKAKVTPKHALPGGGADELCPGSGKPPRKEEPPKV